MVPLCDTRQKLNVMFFFSFYFVCTLQICLLLAAALVAARKSVGLRNPGWWVLFPAKVPGISRMLIAERALFNRAFRWTLKDPLEVEINSQSPAGACPMPFVGLVGKTSKFLFASSWHRPPLCRKALVAAHERRCYRRPEVPLSWRAK